MRGDLATVEELIRISSNGSDWQKDPSLSILAMEEGHEDIALVLLAAQRLHVDDLCTALDVARDKRLERVEEEVVNQLMSSFQAGAICKGLSQEQKNIGCFGSPAIRVMHMQCKVFSRVVVI